MNGSCLCGDVVFDLDLKSINMYQCHCDLCRKQTGTASSCGTVVAANVFSWISGEHLISKWEKSSGFTSHFCSQCGSSVPNKFRDHPFYWVPIGTLNDTLNDALNTQKIKTVANIFVCEQSKWSNVDASTNPFDLRPEVMELVKLMNTSHV